MHRILTQIEKEKYIQYISTSMSNPLLTSRLARRGAHARCLRSVSDATARDHTQSDAWRRHRDQPNATTTCDGDDDKRPRTGAEKNRSPGAAIHTHGKKSCTTCTRTIINCCGEPRAETGSTGFDVCGREGTRKGGVTRRGRGTLRPTPRRSARRRGARVRRAPPPRPPRGAARPQTRSGGSSAP